MPNVAAVRSSRCSRTLSHHCGPSVFRQIGHDAHATQCDGILEQKTREDTFLPNCSTITLLWMKRSETLYIHPSRKSDSR